ncbi:hypothetical protein P4O66_006613 [Electrophorus voltai]|uniref:Ig-like domain-containing protein n=1 Tax=Electrophorus voltai TaxID=2609070 RepID=A0AAD8YNU3_9TELE|nr:hypothetical protein P4O66_006613 [Electrophorus voltai]
MEGAGREGERWRGGRERGNEPCLIVKTFIPCVSAGCSLAENQKTDYITAYTGDSVLLPCCCTDPHAKPESFTWRKRNTSGNTWDVITSESEQYRNRVQLGTAHSPGNLSLLISHLTEEDEGDYRCQTKGNKHKDVKLYVSEAPYKPVNPPPMDTDTSSPTASTKPTDVSKRCSIMVNVGLQVGGGGGFGGDRSGEPGQGQVEKEEKKGKVHRVRGGNRTLYHNQRPDSRLDRRRLGSSLGSGMDGSSAESRSTGYGITGTRTTAGIGTVSPQTLPYIPFALVTVIFLHIIVAVVYYTKRNKVSEMSRVHYNTAGGDETTSLQ